tara:strand:- start:3346 stop:4923 length:1578 start_codon:yes stop_codon:yes gene_type:complete
MAYEKKGDGIHGWNPPSGGTGWAPGSGGTGDDDLGCPQWPAPGACPPGWVNNPPFPICGPCEEINPNIDFGDIGPIDADIDVLTGDGSVGTVVDWCSFDINSPCVIASGLHLQPLLDLTLFMNHMEDHYDNTAATWGGCAWFQNRLDVWLPQLAGIHTGPGGGGGDWGNVNPLNVVHVAQKSAKIAWAQCMQANCCLFPPDPIGKIIEPLDNRDELDELQIPRVNGEEGTKEIIACPCGWQPAFTTAYNHLFKGSPAGGTWHCLIPDHATTDGVNYSILADHIGTAVVNGGEPVKGDKYHKPMTLQGLSWDTWDIFHVGRPVKTALFGNVFSEKVELAPASGDCVTIVDKNFKSDFSNENTFIIPPSDMPIIPQYRLSPIDQSVVAATSAASMIPCLSSHYLQNLLSTVNPVYVQYNLPGSNGWYPWNFLSYHENGFLQYFFAGGYQLSAGCQYFFQKKNQWVNQLANITAPIHHALKSSKIAWIDLMIIDCGCATPPPPPDEAEQALPRIIEQNNYNIIEQNNY